MQKLIVLLITYTLLLSILGCDSTNIPEGDMVVEQTEEENLIEQIIDEDESVDQAIIYEKL